MGPHLYILYTGDIPTLANSTIATFADGTAIITSHQNYDTAVMNLQAYTDAVCRWARRWKTKINEDKTVRVDFALRPHNYSPTIINGVPVALAEEAKYLGVYLDAKLNWKTHVQKKREAVKIAFRSLYWMFSPQNKLSLRNKRTLYNSVLKPIWSYAAPIWGSTAKSNIEILQRQQNIILQKMAGAPWYLRNEQLHQEINIESVAEEIEKIALRYEQRLHKHFNTEAIQLLADPPICRLKR